MNAKSDGMYGVSGGLSGSKMYVNTAEMSVDTPQMGVDTMKGGVHTPIVETSESVCLLDTSSSPNWSTVFLCGLAGVGGYLLANWIGEYLKRGVHTVNNSGQRDTLLESSSHTHNKQPHNTHTHSESTHSIHTHTLHKQTSPNPSHSSSTQDSTHSNHNQFDDSYEQHQQNNNRDERPDMPENAPDSCPGVFSEQAGFSEGCEGCPNQRMCASGDAKRPDPELIASLSRLCEIRHKILVLSGKGGVGKSTISAQLSWGLQKRGYEVGLLDIDICGPSIPRMMGAMGRDVHLSRDGWSPIYVEDNLAVMSIGFLLPEDDDAVIWRGPKKNALIKQFLTDVIWGKMDFLIVDTPPGTSDEHLSIVSYLKEAGIDGAVVVTTPQEMSLQDVRKEINFCKKTNIPILGVVENMANSVFSPNSGGAKHMAKHMNVPFIGQLTLDPHVQAATEAGIGIESLPDVQHGQHEISKLVDKLLVILNEANQSTLSN